MLIKLCGEKKMTRLIGNLKQNIIVAYITRETKYHPLCHFLNYGFAADPLFLETEIASFCLNQGSSTPDNPLRGYVSRGSCKWRYLVFDRKRLEPRLLSWQWHKGCHPFSFVMYISGAKFEDHCSNSSRDILGSAFYWFTEIIYNVVAFLICIMQKHQYV